MHGSQMNYATWCCAWFVWVYSLCSTRSTTICSIYAQDKKKSCYVINSNNRSTFFYHSPEFHFVISMVEHSVNGWFSVAYRFVWPFSMVVLLSDHSQLFRMTSLFQSDSAHFDCVERIFRKIRGLLDSTKKLDILTHFCALLLLHYGYCLLNACKDDNHHISDSNN